MGSAHLRLLAVWVFLSVVFTTSSLAAASSEADVYCIVRPNFPYLDVFLNPLYPGAPAYSFSNTVGEYLCTDPVPSSDLARGANIRIVLPGSGKTMALPADFTRYSIEGVIVTRSAYLIPEYNEFFAVYAAKGAGYLVVDENIPKSVAKTSTSIHGDVVFLNPDPILRIYLRAENGKIDLSHYSISGVQSLPKTDIKIRFASCSLRISDFSTELTTMNGKKYLAGHFKIFDGDSPILIPNLFVQVGDETISPQYSSTDMSYSFFAPYSDDVTSVVISADVPGCSHFEHEEYVNISSGGQEYWVLLILIIAIAAALYYWKRR